MDACQITISAGSENEAMRIADALLEARLAGCVQVVGPVHSRYWWQGERSTALEYLCLVKTRLSLVDPVVAAVRAEHSSETPEIIASPIVAGDADYLAWLEAETAAGGGAA